MPQRMAEMGAHFVDHVFQPLPVRQWVLSLPKRLRYFLKTEVSPKLRMNPSRHHAQQHVH